MFIVGPPWLRLAVDGPSSSLNRRMARLYVSLFVGNYVMSNSLKLYRYRYPQGDRHGHQQRSALHHRDAER